jgi:NADPH-dependent 2,4-dienoyl-CoA reductase/sulfur reductase-like enzyme
VIDGWPSGNLIVSFNGRIAQVDATAVVLATGAVERLLPFPGWTLPGVFGVGGLQALVKAGLDVTDARVVLAGAGPLLLPVAATLAQRGAKVLLIAEQAAAAEVRAFARRALMHPGRLLQATALRWASRTAPYRTDSWVVRATGRDRLERVVMRVGGKEVMYECDFLATAAGLVPRTALAQVLGCQVAEESVVVDDRQATSVPGIFAAGECCGITGDAGAIVEGTIAGIAAAGGTVSARLLHRRDAARRFGATMSRCFAPRRELPARVTADTIICRCEDVRFDRIDPTWSQRQAKLWTRVGMGACQGAVCGPACHALWGWEANAPRPPLEQPALASWAAAVGTVNPPETPSTASPPAPLA